MRAVGVVFALIVCVAAVDLRHQLRRATPEWAAAVTNAQSTLDSRQAEASKLSGQCSSAQNTETARRAAFEEAQRNFISQKVIVAQATAHRNTAQQARDIASQAHSTFKAGPYAQVAQSWKQHAAKKSELDAEQKQITASQQDIVKDFPLLARLRATQDINAAQQALSAKITEYNNLNVAYNAAVLTLAQHQSTLTSAQTALDTKSAELNQAQQTFEKLRQERVTRLHDLKAATTARLACDQQLTQAKQEVVAAVGNLRTSLENQLRALREELFDAQQQETKRKPDLANQEADKKKYADRVKELTAQISKVTSQYNAVQQKLSQAISDFTVAQTNFENAKMRAVSAKQKVAQARSDSSKVKAQPSAPSAAKTPDTQALKSTPQTPPAAPAAASSASSAPSPSLSRKSSATSGTQQAS